MSREVIAAVLRAQRKTSGMTVEDVVSKLRDDYGINLSPKSIYNYESGDRQPDADTLMALCDVYGISNIREVFSDKKTPAGVSADGLDQVESDLVNLFRLVPEGDRALLVQLIETALKSRGLM